MDTKYKIEIYGPIFAFLVGERQSKARAVRNYNHGRPFGLRGRCTGPTVPENEETTVVLRLDSPNDFEG